MRDPDWVRRMIQERARAILRAIEEPVPRHLLNAPVSWSQVAAVLGQEAVNKIRRPK